MGAAAPSFLWPVRGSRTPSTMAVRPARASRTAGRSPSERRDAVPRARTTRPAPSTTTPSVAGGRIAGRRAGREPRSTRPSTAATRRPPRRMPVTSSTSGCPAVHTGCPIAHSAPRRTAREDERQGAERRVAPADRGEELDDPHHRVGLAGHGGPGLPFGVDRVRHEGRHVRGPTPRQLRLSVEDQAPALLVAVMVEDGTQEQDGDHADQDHRGDLAADAEGKRPHHATGVRRFRNRTHVPPGDAVTSTASTRARIKAKPRPLGPSAGRGTARAEGSTPLPLSSTSTVTSASPTNTRTVNTGAAACRMTLVHASPTATWRSKSSSGVTVGPTTSTRWARAGARASGTAGRESSDLLVTMAGKGRPGPARAPPLRWRTAAGPGPGR